MGTTIILILLISVIVLLVVALVLSRRQHNTCSFPDCAFSSILNHLNEGVFVCDVNGRVEALNHYAKTELDLHRGSVLPERFFPDDVRRDTIVKSLNGEESVSLFKIKGDKSYSVRLEVRNNGRILGFYGVIRDITEEEKSRYYTEQYLKQSGLVFLGSIFESLAHEIRTPCLAAEGCFRMIQEDVLSKLEGGIEISKGDIEALKKHCRNGKRTTSQISDLLNYSRGFRTAYREADLGDIEVEEASIYCKETIEAAYNTILSDGIEITTCGSGPYIVKGYLNRFLEALVNILKNSVEAIVEQSRRDQSLVPKIRIFVKSEETFENPEIEQIITIEISDNGSGFEEESRERIGTALFTTKFKDPSSRGTGLGLPLAIQTINSMGGTWEIENIYDNDIRLGTRTIIKIPIPQQLRTTSSLP